MNLSLSVIFKDHDVPNLFSKREEEDPVGVINRYRTEMWSNKDCLTISNLRNGIRFEFETFFLTLRAI